MRSMVERAVPCALLILAPEAHYFLASSKGLLDPPQPCTSLRGVVVDLIFEGCAQRLTTEVHYANDNCSSEKSSGGRS